MTIPNVILDQFITVPWGNAVADSINRGIRGGQSIFEMGTTPAGTVVNELQWSTAHQAMMRWTGTQWVFAGGPPTYFTYDDMWDTATGVVQAGAMGAGTSALIVDAPPHFGIYRATSGAAINTGAFYRGVTSTTGTVSGGAGLRMRAVFSLPSVVSGTLQRIGFHDWNVGGGAVTDGAWLDIVAGVATFNTSTASVATSNVTTATLTASIWYTIHVWFTSATIVRCILHRDDGTKVLDVQNSTNVPSGANRFMPAVGGQMSTNVTGTQLIDLDWFGWGYAPI